MRLLFVAQRYGHEVAGGAELHCRQFATRLAERGHDVAAVTSCAVSYVDWADWYPQGVSELDGVEVHRLAVARRRDDRLFASLDHRVVWGRKPVPFHLQREWMRLQGPFLPALGPWLAEHAASYDVVVFFTYLYYTTWAGLPVASGIAPTVLHPTAHDEPALALPLFDTTFRHPTAFAFSTEEERTLVERRFGIRPAHRVVGIGFDLDGHGDGDRFRSRFGLGSDPYLLFVGRIDPGKGSDELFDFFCAFKDRNPGPLRLVVVGEPIKPLPPHPDVVVTGFVDDETKHDAYAGAVALVQPSYFESFSMVLSEAWIHGLPALVQGHCDVLVGQALRSGGGIPYSCFEEFEVAVLRLLDEPRLGRALGHRGRQFVERRYAWDVVMRRYEELLVVARTWPSRRREARQAE
ncbi:MAG TPA: glycosyltransferase family 4 protein [Acidimicrobiales bacterium]|nr:glycosyltransferase family 4 protein [Acidimicrobiales bacterium]